MCAVEATCCPRRLWDSSWSCDVVLPITWMEVFWVGLLEGSYCSSEKEADLADRHILPFLCSFLEGGHEA